MGPGDLVIYLPDPLLFGRLLILDVRDGRYLCQPTEEEDDEPFIGSFTPDELQLHHEWMKVTLT